MFISPVIRNCGDIRCHWLKFSEYCFPKLSLKSSISFCYSHQYSTFDSNEASETNITSESHKASSERADTFGSLRKSLQQPRSKLKATPVTSDSHYKVKIKRPKFYGHKEANVFGNLSHKEPIWYSDIEESPIVDNDQSDDSNVVRNISRKFRCPKYYLERMKLFVAEKKLKEALELFLDMRRNFVNPMHYHYTYMIGACGRFGYTEMAFKLLRQMTDRGFLPTPATLTGLFNACGESPFPEYSLKKALSLKEKIQTKDWKLSQPTYHAMIKAFGKCGDIQTAFQIPDEMAKADMKIDVLTYSFLLMSCAGNKEAGFTHAIEVWRKMRQRKCKPNLFSFNLLLRATRDCDIGPEEISCLLLQHWSSFANRPYGFERKEILPNKKEPLRIESAGIVDILPDMKVPSSSCLEDSNVIDVSETPTSESRSKNLQKKLNESSAVMNVVSGVPSVLNTRPVRGAEVLELGNIKTSSDRLALLGNAEGFLLDMKKYAKPNIKTFTLLLECLPPSTQAEEELLSLLDVYSVIPDISFFNILIKKRTFRFDNIEARKVLLLVNKWSLTPDILTFGVLALGCRSHQQAAIFINDMRKLGFSPNTEIVGALLGNACTSLDFDYLQNTLKLMEEEGIEPNEKMLLKLEEKLKIARRNIIDMEHGHSVSHIYKKEGFSKAYKDFCEKYEHWLKNIKFDKEEHVWAQYKTDIFEKTTEVAYNS